MVTWRWTLKLSPLGVRIGWATDSYSSIFGWGRIFGRLWWRPL